MSIFTVRSIPESVHHSWKVISALKGCTMREYLLHALRKQLEVDVESFQKKEVLKKEKDERN